MYLFKLKPMPVTLAPLVVNIAIATQTWNLFNVDLTQVCSCLITPHALQSQRQWLHARKGGRNRERNCLIPCISPPAFCTKAKVAKGGEGGEFAGHYGTTCTNSGVLSSTVLNGMELEILEPLHWLMVWEWTGAWKHWRKLLSWLYMDLKYVHVIWMAWVTSAPVWSPWTGEPGASNYICLFPHSVHTHITKTV